MLQFLSNNLNPIFVKEIRQFTRSNFIAVLVNLYILLLVFVFLSFLSSFVTDTDKYHLMIVRTFWRLFGNVVVWTCFFSVVVRTVWSTSIERNNDDLMFYSSIKPSTIVFGKLLTGAVTTFILMSITMPFVVLLNLLGGSDLLYMMCMLIEIFVIMQIMNALAILIASVFKMPFANFLSLIAISIVFGFVHTALFYPLIDWDGTKLNFLGEFILLLVWESIVFVFIICIAIAKFSPQNSNRSFYVRLVATIIFLTTIVCTLFISPLKELLPYVVVITFFILMFFLPTVVCERDQWSPRIRQNLPKSLDLRFILFPFYNGSACGLVWIGLMMVVLVLVDLLAFFPFFGGASLFICDQNGICRQIILLFIFIFDACVTAMLVRSWFLKQVHTSRVWLLAILILLLVTLGSYIVAGIYFSFYGVNFMEVTNLHSTWWNQYKESSISSINPFMLLPAMLNIRYSPSLLEFPVELFINTFWALIQNEESFSRCYG
ncbi:MAG: hypothetical protein LBK06_10465, partial [Planctomycetaceae bacterium]|nr:hypothetical protein [Planctomycetaceae bacterium]